MQTNYPNKLPPTSWDTVHITYPVRKNPITGVSSETIGRQWRSPPDVLKAPKYTVDEEKHYNRDYNLTQDLLHTQTNRDYRYKIPEACRFNKHTSCNENFFVYPPSRKFEDRTPAEKVHGTTEMKSSYTEPLKSCRLTTEKEQFKHPASLSLELPEIEPFEKGIEQMDTTYEGFEKHLDPYLTTNRLHHRPFTADVLSRSSNSKDILTYYIYSNTPWVRSPKPNIEKWQLPRSKPKPICDKEKFKDDFREIRTHNKLKWVPRTFCTEARDNYIQQTGRPESRIHNYEEDVRSEYKRSIANLQISTEQQQSAIKYLYTTENSHIGSGKPIYSIIDQHIEKNRKLAKREEHNI